MPKQIPQETQEQWIDLSNQGLTPAQIKRRLKTNSDIRTIEKVISRAAIDRTSNEVRKRASIEALAKHWEALSYPTLALLDVVGKGHGVRFRKRPVFAFDVTQLSGNGWKAMKRRNNAGVATWKVELDYESTVEARLLKSHTGQNDLWRAIDQFRVAQGRFLGARLSLAKDTVNAVETATDLKIRDDEGAGLNRSGIAMLDEALFATATTSQDQLGEVSKLLKLEHRRKSLHVGGSLLVSSDTSLSEGLGNSIISGLEELRGTESWKEVAASEVALVRAVANLKDEITIMQTMPLLPGSCKACRQVM